MLKFKIISSLILIGFLSGCSNSSSNDSSQTFFPTGLKPQEPYVIMDALKTGTLEEDENGCLVVANSLMIWPYGSYIEDNVIYDSDDTIIAVVGESVSFGGGSIPMPTYLEDNPCSSEYYFLVQTY